MQEFKLQIAAKKAVVRPQSYINRDIADEKLQKHQIYLAINEYLGANGFDVEMVAVSESSPALTLTKGQLDGDPI